MSNTEEKLDKIIKLLEDIKAGQPMPYSPRFLYPPIPYYPQPYIPMYPDLYQPHWTCTTTGGDLR